LPGLRRLLPGTATPGVADKEIRSCGVANVYEPHWDADFDRPPFAWRRARLGRQAGCEKLGTSLYELPPGASSFPLHIHHANEELIIVLSGRPTLRGLDTERELSPGDIVACPTGREGAHRLDNRQSDAVRVLIVSTMLYPEINEYPDSGKVMVRNYPPGGEAPAESLEMILRTDAREADYFAGETESDSEG
jgi:uncharacterized cupin superfamily protein